MLRIRVICTIICSLIAMPMIAHMSQDKTVESCLAGEWLHCDRFVEILSSKERAAEKGFEYDIDAAIEVGKAGCAVGQLDVCYRYAQLRYKSSSGKYTDKRSAESMWKQMCQSGHKESCEAIQRHGIK